jgi:hypothetical protein
MIRFGISAPLIAPACIILGMFFQITFAQDADTVSSKNALPDTSNHIVDTPITSDTAFTVNTVTSPVFDFFDSIAGLLPDTVKAKDKPYIVVGDIEAPMNKTVVIEPGTIFLFKNFTGLHVQGTLIATGTMEKPIIFTSENDRSVNKHTSLFANPYDWNGIYIHSNGIGAVFSYCNVSYSVYGITSETKFIRLDPVTLRFNGKDNLIIEGRELKTSDRQYYYILSRKDAVASGLPRNFFKNSFSLKRDLAGYGCFAIIVTSIIKGIDSGLNYLHANNDLKKISADNPSILRNIDESDWTRIKNKRDDYRRYCVFSLAGLAIGVAGFSWTFTF